jgi:hypothetical protein
LQFCFFGNTSPIPRCGLHRSHKKITIAILYVD